MENWLLTIILFIPLVGALFVLLSPSESHAAIRRISLWTMVADLLLGIILFFEFDPNLYEMQFTELRARWFEIGGLTIYYSIGIDGISFLLVELTLLLGPVVILSSWSAVEQRVKEYHLLLLLLQTGMIGAFVALDFFLFYVFWELMLIPMYFLIGIWGGGRKIYAAIKFFLFTMAGSVLML
ncbi:MAG: Fe-S-binding domain-containing protein, partial [Desulfobacterota bacterium]|nr:Fe-S-binding domain-containing protein [Thermodesulfobacteriota bacterium]